MEREKFEESWKDAFENAGIAPSDGVWVNIELELEKAKGGQLKRRLMFYQMLAAASVVLAMTIGGVAYYYNFNERQPSPNTLALETNTLPSQTHTSETGATPDVSKNQRSPQSSSDARSESPAAANQQGDNNPDANNSINGGLYAGNFAVRKAAGGDTPVGAGENRSDGSFTSNGNRAEAQLPLAVNDRHVTQLYTPRQIEIDMQPQREEAEVDPVVAMLARLDRREKEMRGEEKEKEEQEDLSEKLWTSIGFAAGSFNTMQSAGAQPAAMAFNAAPIVDQETKASGYAYSMGVNIGTKLSRRWVFQGGVNYLTNSSDYTANNVVVTSAGPQQQRFRAATTHEIINSKADELNNKIVYSAPYNVNNSMRYLSIPMQAGYMLINKTFGLQLNAGVATDVFLQNTVTPDSDNMDRTTQPGGAESPYRTFNLSGLVGTEFSYRFGEHYRLALNPGVRYPFNTIYKSELGVQASPLTFDVGLRFRYIFH